MHDLELDLYERDFPCWAERQAELLRRGLADQADLARIAEELEALGSEQRNKVHSHTSLRSTAGRAGFMPRSGGRRWSFTAWRRGCGIRHRCGSGLIRSAF